MMRKIMMLLFSFWLLTVEVFVYAKGPSIEECEKRRQKVSSLSGITQTTSSNLIQDLEKAKKKLDKCLPVFQTLQNTISCDMLNVEVLKHDGSYYLHRSPYKDRDQLSTLNLTPTEENIAAQWRFNECMSYWEDHPTFEKCYFLWEQLRFKSNVKGNDEKRREFAKCKPLLQALAKEFPCENFNRHKGPGDKFTYVSGLVYKNENPSLSYMQRRQLEQEKIEKIKKAGISSNNVQQVEELRFYECIPQWEEEQQQAIQARQQQEKLAQQQQAQALKTAKTAYFSKCPKGITTSSFDCYALDKKFVNYGFRGLPLRKLNPKEINATTGLEHCDWRFPKNVEVYYSNGPEEEIQISVINGVIATIAVVLRPRGISPHAIHLTMKKRFPTVAEPEPGMLHHIKKNGQAFTAEKNVEFPWEEASAEELEGHYVSYNICYESALLEATHRKEERAQLRKEENNAQELF